MRSTRALALVAAAALPVAITNAKIVAHWRLDEAPDATTAIDSAGGFTGTLAGDAQFLPGDGIANGCISMTEAGSGYITMGDVLSFPPSQPFSISLWVKNSTPTASQFPLAKHTAGVVAGYFIALNANAGYGADDKAFFYDGIFPGSEALGVSTVTDGEWRHIVAVRSPGQDKRIYIDGVLEDIAGPGNGLQTGAPLVLGGLLFGDTIGSIYTGEIDDVQVYDEALASGDALYLFKNPGDIICRGDIDGSFSTNSVDLNLLLAEFGCTSGCTADIDGDGAVNSIDLNILLANFGVVCKP